MSQEFGLFKGYKWLLLTKIQEQNDGASGHLGFRKVTAVLPIVYVINIHDDELDQ